MSKKFELMPSAEGIFALAKEKHCKVNSIKIAEVLEIEHSKLIRTIEEKILSKESGWSEEFGNAHFGVTSYKDVWNRKQKSYDMDREGMTAVFMSYNTPKANHFKEDYINAFNTMEDLLRSVYESRLSFPQMTDAIKRNFSEEEIREKWLYSRESNLIYMVVFGHNAKWIRGKFGIDKEQNILSCVKDKQKVDLCVSLQNANATLIDLGLGYEERKDKLKSMLIKRLGYELSEYQMDEQLECFAKEEEVEYHKEGA